MRLILGIAAYIFVVLCILGFCSFWSVLFLELCGNDVVSKLPIGLFIAIGFFGLMGTVLFTSIVKDSLG